MVTKLFRIFIYVAGVFVSLNYADGYWIVGSVFGLVVIGWDSSCFRKIVPAKHFAFLAASTLIYALVFYISSQRWAKSSDLAESLYGPFAVAIIVGSALLPFAQKFLLKATDKNVAQTIPLLIFSYYIVTFASFANDHWELDMEINFLFVMIAVWQGAYLYFLFPQKKSA